jgi:hypothetical protein
MFIPAPGTISVRAGNADLVDGVCHSVACEVGGLPIRAGLVLLTILLALGLFATLKHIREAQSVLGEERKRTAEERDALAAFQRRVSTLEATRPTAAGGEATSPTGGNATILAGGNVVAATRPPDGQLDRLTEAYRETVMAVAHYEEEYDEPIEVNMNAELGEEIATAVFDGGALTPQLKRGVLQQCDEGRARREELLEAIDREERRLSRAGRELHEIDAALEAERPEHVTRLSFEELSRRWDELGEVEGRCQDLIEERQTSPGADQFTRGNTDLSFREYVYSSLPTAHPVLSDGTRLLDRIQETRRTLLRALTRRV